MDLKDKASFYYKLLRLNPSHAQWIICGESTEVGEFFEDETIAQQEKLHEEFNTLSIVYNKP